MFGGWNSCKRFCFFSGDVADAILKVLYKKIKKPINIGSGKGISIKNLVNSILKTRYVKNKIKNKL